MPLNIIISGKPGSGKTTLVKRIVEEFKDKINFVGFYTEEIRENGRRVGFKIKIINDGELLLAIRNPKGNFKNYYVFVDNVDKVSKELIKYVGKDYFIVIDEIGPMEMKSGKFRKLVNALLSSKNNYIVTIHRSLVDKYNFRDVFWLENNFEEIYKKIKKLLKYC